MRLTVPYTSVLLAASLSGVWATPIAINNRNTIQRRPEAEFRSRTTEFGPVEARGLSFTALSARTTAKNEPVGNAEEEKKEGSRSKETSLISSFTFQTPLSVESGSSEKEAKEKARERVKKLLDRAFPGVTFNIPEPTAGMNPNPNEQLSSDVGFSLLKDGKVKLSGILGHAATGEDDELWEGGHKLKLVEIHPVTKSS